jgi:hypothetical protein
MWLLVRDGTFSWALWANKTSTTARTGAIPALTFLLIWKFGERILETILREGGFGGLELFA